MLTDAQRRHYFEQGYLLVPQVLAPDEVAQVRGMLVEQFERASAEPGGSEDRALVYEPITRAPALHALTFRPDIVEIVRDLFGEQIVSLPVTDLQLNQFGPWHRDTGTVERWGHTFHTMPDFAFLNLAFYMQDNTPEYGGGLEVEPGSHLTMGSRVGFRGEVRAGFGEVRSAPDSSDDVVSIPSRAGDLVIFDFNLKHRGSRGTLGPRPGHDKLAVFYSWCIDSPHWRPFMEFISGRRAYRHFADFEWPAELVALAETAGVKLATIDREPAVV